MRPDGEYFIGADRDIMVNYDAAIEKLNDLSLRHSARLDQVNAGINDMAARLMEDVVGLPKGILDYTPKSGKTMAAQRDDAIAQFEIYRLARGYTQGLDLPYKFNVPVTGVPELGIGVDVRGKWAVPVSAAEELGVGVDITFVNKVLDDAIKPAPSFGVWLPLLLSFADDIVAVAAAKKSGTPQQKPEDDMVEVEVDILTLFYGEFMEFGFTQSNGVFNAGHPFIRPAVDIYRGAITSLGGQIQI